MDREIACNTMCCQNVRNCSMLAILICDNDLAFLAKLRTAVESLFQSREMKVKIYCHPNPSKIGPQILKSIDIALLDIDFEDENYNGMDIAKTLRKERKDSIIMFVTNFIEYAPEGYKIQAFRYILKQQLGAELNWALDAAITQLNSVRETLKFQVSGEIVDIPLADILYLEVNQHNITLYTKTRPGSRVKNAYSFYAVLSDLENQLVDRGFLRIHKSYLVNMQYIVKFQCREVVLEDGIVLRSSEKKYVENKEKYLIWKGF